jgi:hypothetical protein
MRFMTIRRAVFSAVAVLSLAGTGLAVAAVPAGADTHQCAVSTHTHNGVVGAYCDSQEIVSANLELAVPNKAVAYSRLTFKTTSTTNPQQDWENYNPAVHPDNQKIFEWAPKGVLSGLCMAVSNTGTLPVLKACSTARAAQQWVAVDNGDGTFQWKSEANGKSVLDPNNLAYTRATLGVTGSPFTYVQ